MLALRSAWAVYLTTFFIGFGLVAIQNLLDGKCRPNLINSTQYMIYKLWFIRRTAIDIKPLIDCIAQLTMPLHCQSGECIIHERSMLLLNNKTCIFLPSNYRAWIYLFTNVEFMCEWSCYESVIVTIKMNTFWINSKKKIIISRRINEHIFRISCDLRFGSNILIVSNHPTHYWHYRSIGCIYFVNTIFR